MSTRSRTKSKRAPGRPAIGAGPRLTRQHVLEAALRIIDRDGVGSLGTRRLAAHLGVAPNALYSYVRNKNDLVQGAIALLLGGIEIPSAQTRSWTQRLREICVWFRRRLLQHPNVVAASHESVPFAPIFVALGEILQKAGFESEELVEATYALSFHTLGFVTMEVTRHQRVVAGKSDRALVARASSLLIEDDYGLTEQVLPFVRGLDLDSVFERGLDAIIDELANRRRRASSNAGAEQQIAGKR